MSEFVHRHVTNTLKIIFLIKSQVILFSSTCRVCSDTHLGSFTVFKIFIFKFKPFDACLRVHYLPFPCSYFIHFCSFWFFPCARKKLHLLTIKPPFQCQRILSISRFVSNLLLLPLLHTLLFIHNDYIQIIIYLAHSI